MLTSELLLKKSSNLAQKNSEVITSAFVPFFQNQKMAFYLSILEGNVYPKMLADFWMFAYLRIDPEGRTTIVSEVRGAEVSITPSTISELLRCSNTEATFDDNSFTMTTSVLLASLMENDPYTAKLLRIWHQLLVGNFYP